MRDFMICGPRITPAWRSTSIGGEIDRSIARERAAADWWRHRLSKVAARPSMMSLVPATIIPAAGVAIVARMPTA
jgi:hypothetical protein